MLEFGRSEQVGFFLSPSTRVLKVLSSEIDHKSLEYPVAYPFFSGNSSESELEPYHTALIFFHLIVTILPWGLILNAPCVHASIGRQDHTYNLLLDCVDRQMVWT